MAAAAQPVDYAEKPSDLSDTRHRFHGNADATFLASTDGAQAEPLVLDGLIVFLQPIAGHLQTLGLDGQLAHGSKQRVARHDGVALRSS